MDIHITNTLSRNKELFVPLKPGHVSIYHCGPTVYWTQHIGNMRAVAIVDFVHRTFLANKYQVTLVRNYTDVGHLTGDNVGDADTGEDRMTKAVRREQLTPEAIAQKYIDVYAKDIALLNTLPPTHAPRATEFISQMIAMVSKLIANGNAYTTDKAVYFDVSTYPDYTKLSGQKLEKLETGEGKGSVSDPAKKNPNDFALWFFKTGVHANALQTWPSPFTSPAVQNGEGFPGWHIECSAMSEHFLGTTFDIHMGGVEHIPIHHTNEIAQSTCANHAEFVHYWLHNEHLIVDGKKMAKSDGTSYTLSDIIDRGFDPLALRYFFLQAHYRSKQNFTWDSLEAANVAYRKLKNLIQELPAGGTIHAEYHAKFLEAMNDDFNTPKALAIVWELVKDTAVSDSDKKTTLLEFDRILGLNLHEKSKDQNIEIPEEVQKLLEQRKLAREQKDWKKSDGLRDAIAQLGFTVKDTDKGQTVQEN